jgi:hypothetical protein
MAEDKFIGAAPNSQTAKSKQATSEPPPEQTPRPKDEVVSAPPEPAVSIIKPSKVDLSAFRSTKSSEGAGVQTLSGALPVHELSDAKDFVKIHSDPAYTSSELCFVNIPIEGQRRDTVHLIHENLAMRYLSAAEILRHRLALATKPNDHFFLCQVPSQNLENTWNASALQGCEEATRYWVKAVSLREAGADRYQIQRAVDQDVFPEPKWPTQSLDELIIATFAPHRMITSDDHPGLRRKIGARQSLS